MRGRIYDGGNLILHYNVAIIVYDNPQRQYSGQNDPWDLSDDLVEDIKAASHGVVVPHIIYQMEIDGTAPQKQGGGVDYTEVLDDGWKDKDNPDISYDLRDLVGEGELGEVDEIWMWSDRTGGFAESMVVGPSPFFLNSYGHTDSNVRNVIVMGFNYGVVEGNMLESMAHRIEAHIARIYGDDSLEETAWPPGFNDDEAVQNPATLWDQFQGNWALKEDASGNRAGSGQSFPASPGMVHWAPNAAAQADKSGSPACLRYIQDNYWDDRPRLDKVFDSNLGFSGDPPTSGSCGSYDPLVSGKATAQWTIQGWAYDDLALKRWGEYQVDNTQSVWCDSSDWRNNAPDLSGSTSDTEQVSRSTWMTSGNGGLLAQDTNDERANFMCWWMYHLMWKGGVHEETRYDDKSERFLNNWWQYIANINRFDRYGQFKTN